MIIADLTLGQWHEAVALRHEAGLIRPWNDAEQDLRRAMSGPASTVLAANDASTRLVGTAMVGHDGHRGWVYYLAVASAAQRQGVGSALMAACEGWVAKRHMGKLQLMVRSTNPDALGFYEALGYLPGDVRVLSRSLSLDPGSDPR